MCGIAGIVDYSTADLNRDAVLAMGRAIDHRGPDDQGEWFERSVGLVHRRLSIIDLTSAGHQPMVSGKATLIYNGEIYNSPDLRDELKASGACFAGHSDTEVLLRAYEHWGYGCLERLNGMFAFAIWDRLQDTLFVARDRFGIKPFYYSRSGERFCFASEIKSLLKCPWVPRQPDTEIAYDYLAANYLDHSSRTFFQGISRLEPAHAMEISRNGIKSWQYYNVSFDKLSPPKTEREAIGGFRDLFADAVSKRMLSDVPIAVNLSGGLDSSAVTCQLARLNPADPVRTFSARFPNHPEDEGPFIDLIARSVRLSETPVQLRPVSVVEEINGQIKKQDQPIMSAAMFAKGEVMRTVGEHGIKVVLEGQGADEVLCGYPNAVLYVIADLIKAMRLRTAAKELRAAMALYNQRCREIMGPATDIAFPRLKAILARRPRIHGATVQGPDLAWLARDFRNGRSPTPNPAEIERVTSSIDRYCLGGLRLRSLPFYLRSDDHNAMAYGVEAREPFLDHRLVDYVFSLPPHFRFRDGTSKWILRQSMRGIVPDAILHYPGKRAFPTPQAAWLEQDSDAVRTILLSNEFKNCGLFDVEQVLNINQRVHEGRNSDIVWRTLSYFAWLTNFGFV